MSEREDIGFRSHGARCAAWLYRPSRLEGEGPDPLVILAHGFGGTRDARLWAYAERFREAGMAALVFDYRHFGGSEGEPRQLIDIGRQLEDWHAAIAFAHTLEGIDPERIALWGTSFSGGHVVRVAAEDESIAAVVSQTPLASGHTALASAGPGAAWRLTGAGARDAIAGLRGAGPRRIPLVARPGEVAAMSQPTALDGYASLFDDRADFRNEFCPRAALALGIYRPDRFAPRVRCPLLVCVVADDDVTPPEPARRMAERAPLGECIDYGEQGGHFEIYTGELFERAVADQTAFLARSLRVAEPAGVG